LAAADQPVPDQPEEEPQRVMVEILLSCRLPRLVVAVEETQIIIQQAHLLVVLAEVVVVRREVHLVLLVLPDKARRAAMLCLLPPHSLLLGAAARLQPEDQRQIKGLQAQAARERVILSQAARFFMPEVAVEAS
jgi:hypothetical protein